MSTILPLLYLLVGSISSIDSTPIAADLCSREIVVTNETPARFVSHVGYGTVTYEHNKSCKWLLTVPSGQYVLLTYTGFRVELDDYCRYDRVTIYDGNSTEDSVLAIHCGYTIPAPVRSNSNQMYVVFSINQLTNCRGFEAQVNATASPGIYSVSVDKPAIQSSAYSDHQNASLAVDDSLPSCSLTKQEANPWWRVDLQDEYYVSKVAVKTTVRYSPFDVTKWDVRVSNSALRGNPDNDYHRCNSTMYRKADSFIEISFNCDKYGRYLYVILHGETKLESLELCNVITKGFVYKTLKDQEQCEDISGGRTHRSDMPTFPHGYIRLYQPSSFTNGSLVGWRFNAGRTGRIWFDIWRPYFKSPVHERITWQLLLKTRVIISYVGVVITSILDFAKYKFKGTCSMLC